MINLDDISKENKSILDTYALKNSRTNNRQYFIPFASDKEKTEIINNTDIKEKKSENSIKQKPLTQFVDKMFEKEKGIYQEKSSNVKNKNKINVNIEAFLQGEYDKFMQTSPKNHIKKTEPLKFMPPPFFNEKIKAGVNNKVDAKDSLDLNDFLKNNNALKKSSLSQETIEIIREVYDYLFDTLETFSAVYENYSTIFENIEEIKTFQPIKNPNKIDVRQFLLKYRNSEQLLMKLNMIALAIGNYNLHLIADEYKNATDFLNKPKNEFLNQLEINYNGTEFDLAYLKEFLTVVRGDLSGQYIFEELNNKNNQEEYKEIKKELPKKKSLFSSLNNKK